MHIQNPTTLIREVDDMLRRHALILLNCLNFLLLLTLSLTLKLVLVEDFQTSEKIFLLSIDFFSSFFLPLEIFSR